MNANGAERRCSVVAGRRPRRPPPPIWLRVVAGLFLVTAILLAIWFPFYLDQYYTFEESIRILLLAYAALVAAMVASFVIPSAVVLLVACVVLIAEKVFNKRWPLEHILFVMQTLMFVGFGIAVVAAALTARSYLL